MGDGECGSGFASAGWAVEEHMRALQNKSGNYKKKKKVLNNLN